MTRTGTSEARFPNLFGNLSGARYFLELAITAATYFGIAETALLLPAINATATPLWPPTGLALSLYFAAQRSNLACDFHRINFR